MDAVSVRVRCPPVKARRAPSATTYRPESVPPVALKPLSSSLPERTSTRPWLSKPEVTRIVVSLAAMKVPSLMNVPAKNTVPYDPVHSVASSSVPRLMKVLSLLPLLNEWVPVQMPAPSSMNVRGPPVPTYFLRTCVSNGASSATRVVPLPCIWPFTQRGASVTVSVPLPPIWPDERLPVTPISSVSTVVSVLNSSRTAPLASMIGTLNVPLMAIARVLLPPVRTMPSLVTEAVSVSVRAPSKMMTASSETAYAPLSVPPLPLKSRRRSVPARISNWPWLENGQ